MVSTFIGNAGTYYIMSRENGIQVAYIPFGKGKESKGSIITKGGFWLDKAKTTYISI